MGIFGTAGYLHVSEYDRQRWPIKLHLLPESLVHLSVHDAELVPSCFDQSRVLYRPRLPEHCVSLVKCLEDHLPRSSNRERPERDLVTLFATGVYKIKDFEKIWITEEETESEANFRARRLAAAEEIRGWRLAEEDEPYRAKLIEILISGVSEYSGDP